VADNYILGSFMLPLRTEEELEWVRVFLEEVDEQLANYGEPENPVGSHIYHGGGSALGNGYVRGSRNDDRHLWVYSDEQFDVEEAALVVQAYLKKWAPEACFIFTYAETCSKPRPGEFSGGSVLVTIKDWWVVGPQMQRQYLLEEHGEGLEVLGGG
jgi:hypothetical protein